MAFFRNDECLLIDNNELLIERALSWRSLLKSMLDFMDRDKSAIK